jgi:hypothetical protein
MVYWAMALEQASRVPAANRDREKMDLFMLFAPSD